MDIGPILVVDDDSAARAILGLSLRRAGYTVLTAATGDQALKALEDESIGWLITDAVMAPMNGFELSRRARELRPDLRIAMVSAVATPSNAASASIDRFFSKPIALDGLLSWLQGTA